MSCQAPPEIAALIVSHVADDFETLKSVALTCQEFCVLAQSHLFSTICLNGKAESAAVARFEELLKSQTRGAIIAGYIRNLSLLYCVKWFIEDKGDCVRQTEGQHVNVGVENDRKEVGYEDTEELPATCCAIEFIAEHAKYLEAIHLGPFCSDIHIDWYGMPEKVRNALTRLLTNAQEIVLEGVANIPLALLQNLHAVKSLDISDTTLSGEWQRPDVSISILPRPTSLAIHTGTAGAAADENQWWDMCGFLSVLRSQSVMDLSHLTALYLHLLDSPGRNALIRDTISCCANTLQNLRLYIWDEDIYDNNVIDLSQLTSLKSLYLMVNLPNVEDSLLYMAKSVNTITVPDTHLAELHIFIDVSNEHPEWLGDMIRSIRDAGSWATLLNAKLAQILQTWDDTRITFNLPWARERGIITARMTRLFSRVLPDIAVGSTTHDRFTIDGLGVGDLAKPLTLRNEMEFWLAVDGQV
ncbi:hypothetical protein AX15_000742 [Amanita polypyramis BW_CC]|nr:hypothetical protein AX15_000742 [Amanita polypyramis BW_CC]